MSSLRQSVSVLGQLRTSFLLILTKLKKLFFTVLLLETLLFRLLCQEMKELNKRKISTFRPVHWCPFCFVTLKLYTGNLEFIFTAAAHPIALRICSHFRILLVHLFFSLLIRQFFSV